MGRNRPPSHNRHRQLPSEQLVNKYTVISDNLSGHQAGDTVTEEDLEGCSVSHLVESGHIIPAKTTKKETE